MPSATALTIGATATKDVLIGRKDVNYYSFAVAGAPDDIDIIVQNRNPSPEAALYVTLYNAAGAVIGVCDIPAADGIFKISKTALAVATYTVTITCNRRVSRPRFSIKIVAP